MDWMERYKEKGNACFTWLDIRSQKKDFLSKKINRKGSCQRLLDSNGEAQKVANRLKIPEDRGILISGARITDTFSEEALQFAELYYAEIRSFSTDAKRIAQNLGKSEEDVRKIKAYLFEDKSLYDPDIDEWRRFDPDCAIAQSWQRLMIGKDIKPHDRTLIEHELYEMELKKNNPGMSHEEAHVRASKKYDYRKEAADYYDSLKKHSKIGG